MGADGSTPARQTTVNPLLDAALAYARRGWHVLPLCWPDADGNCACPKHHTNPKEVGKAPLPIHAKDDATTDIGIIRMWWRTWPKANIGIRCGAISGIVALDEDTEAGNAVARLEADYEELPHTIESLTGGGGRHILFGHPGGAITSSTAGPGGIHIRADESYIVVPPSLHRSGRRYEWECTHDPEDTTLAPLPSWLGELLAKREHKENGNGHHTESTMDDIAAATRALARLSQKRCEDYQGGGWINVGMILHRFGDVGLELWKEWSRKSAKYVPGECERKWATFDDSRELGMGSLIQWGQVDAVGNTQPTETAETSTETADSDLPEIEVSNRPLSDKTRDALNALVTHEEEIFVRARALVRVGRDENGLPVIERLSEAALRGHMERSARWIKLTAKDVPISVSPPLDVVQDIASLGTWPFPPLGGIIESPSIRSDGSLLVEPGYDPTTRLYYAPFGNLDLPPITERPTDGDVTTAVQALLDLIKDFPFAGETGKDNELIDANRANALAILITPVLRPIIIGKVPMALFDKPQAGTGASLLAEIVTIIATGRQSAMLSAPHDDETWRKTITSLVISDCQVACIDNIEGALYAPSLAAVLTSGIWKDRLLGESRMITFPHRICWIATGNNVQLRGDLPRRCVWVRMDAQNARPWQRKGFAHPDLPEYVTQERGRILAAILTLARAWIVEGRKVPEDLPVLGSFESWRNTLGGILAHAGIKGFLGNLESMYEQADTETPQWEAFLTAWYEVYHDTPVKLGDLAKALPNLDALANALPDDLSDGAQKDAKGFTRRLAWALRKRVGKVFPGGLFLKAGKAEHNAILWRVMKRFPTRPGGVIRVVELFSTPRHEMNLLCKEEKRIVNRLENHTDDSYNSPPMEQETSQADEAKGWLVEWGYSTERLEELTDAEIMSLWEAEDRKRSSR